MFNDVNFMKEFISTKTLTDESCRILVAACQFGYTDALESIIKGFSSMIISFIPYEQRNLEIASDKYQNGVIGLIKAVYEFDLDSTTKFSTYAYVSIKRSIQKTNSRLMMLPVSFWKLMKQYEYLQKDTSLSDIDICELLNIKLTTLENLKYIAKNNYVESLDNDNVWKTKVCEEDILEQVMKKVDGEQLYSKIDQLLNERQVEIIKLHLGIESEPHTFQEIGERYGISKQRVQVLFKNGLSVLKENETIEDLAKEYL